MGIYLYSMYSMEKDEKYTELLDRFMRGETSADEDAKLLAWFRDSSSHESLYYYYRNRWEEAKRHKLPIEIQERMFRRICGSMPEARNVGTFQSLSHRTGWWLRWGLSAAAVIMFCVGLATMGYYYYRISEFGRQVYVVEADRGQRSSVVLPDGTKVWLNSRTQVSYQGNYGQKERIVNLSGEAYFEVAKDPDRHFVVKVDGLEVEALGTAFNVKAYEEDDEIIASLREGRVRTSVGGHVDILDSGQSLSYSKVSGKVELEDDDVEYHLKWRENELAFRGETLEEIADMLDRLYNVNIEFDSENIKRYRFSGVIKNNSLDNVFELISLTAPIEYTKANDTIRLRLRK